MDPIAQFTNGFKEFRKGGFQDKRATFEALVDQGQNPNVALIACSDSRVDPAMVLQTDPGDLFVVRNAQPDAAARAGWPVSRHQRRALIINDDSWSFMWERPLTLSILVIAFLILVVPPLIPKLGGLLRSRDEEAGEGG